MAYPCERFCVAMLRLNDEGKTSALEFTSLANEGFKEEDLREWIIDSSSDILGEELFLIGREVSVQELGDAIDILGIDRDGNLVIIELKRGSLRDPVDFQGLKYAAYTAQWDYEELKEQFEYFKSTRWGQKLYDGSVSFTEQLDSFCNEDYTFNQDQRMLLVGESIRERLNLVVRWLADRSVDVAVVEVDLLKEGDRLYIDADQTIPAPEESPPKIRPDTSDKPWKADSRNWHLNERTNHETSELLEEIVASIEEVESLDGPDWEQKLYIAFRQARKIRVTLRTHQGHFHVRILDIDPGDVDVDELSTVLGINPKNIVATDPLPGTRRAGVQITCYGGDSIDGGALAEEITTILRG